MQSPLVSEKKRKSVVACQEEEQKKRQCVLYRSELEMRDAPIPCSPVTLLCEEPPDEMEEYERLCLLSERHTCAFVSGEITSRMRAQLVEWLIQVTSYLRLSQEALHLTVNLLDRFSWLSLPQVSPVNFQVYGIACLSIAAKFDSCKFPVFEDYVYACGYAFSVDQITRAESQVINALNFEVVAATACQVVLLLSRKRPPRAQSMALYLSELSLLFANFKKFGVHTVGKAAVLASHLYLNLATDWLDQYPAPDTELCAKILLKVFQDATLSDSRYVRGVYRRYNCEQHFFVAKGNS